MTKAAYPPSLVIPRQPEA